MPRWRGVAAVNREASELTAGFVGEFQSFQELRKPGVVPDRVKKRLDPQHIDEVCLVIDGLIRGAGMQDRELSCPTAARASARGVTYCVAAKRPSSLKSFLGFRQAALPGVGCG